MSTVQRLICIHGHFYQPPRENPWTGRVERQPSAAPFHDWNQRITEECYAPNAAAKVLDRDGRVVRRVDNYSAISFDFGPTLLAWLAAERPEVHDAVILADRRSRRRFSGHGSAMAQAYHHTILPLASARDRRTEVRWGISDFRHRFGRDPEGLWLPETAVDVGTLEVLAAEGVRFTVLEPHQAARWRPLDGGEWTESAEGRGPDTCEPHLCRLPSGAEIALFFYDGPLSRDVAFNGLLHDGGRFARSLYERGEAPGDGAGLLSIATDGETYGHHHRFGEMALAKALTLLDDYDGTRLTNFAEHLAGHPPRREVEVHEGTSWSCPHGVGRWSRDCGCGRETGGHQRWREPLRDALVWLRDELAGPWEAAAGELLADPWAARDAYVRLLLDRSPAAEEAFFAEHAARPLDAPERRRARGLLELQRNALRMFTSCGWFFEDVARIETVQVMLYAARAMELAAGLTGADLEPGFLDRLAAAPANEPPDGDAARVYRRQVEAARRLAGPAARPARPFPAAGGEAASP
jgi:alpha-amylase/alpha-mannosidase (GH57 family)